LFPDKMEKRDHGAGPVPSIERETTMEEYIGLDISLKDTAISVRRDGKRIWRGKCPSDPNLLAEVIRKRAPAAERVVFETGPLSVWFYHALCADGLPAICIDARHAKAALDMAPNKTDANDEPASPANADTRKGVGQDGAIAPPASMSVAPLA
jgi:hypothetical protein